MDPGQALRAFRDDSGGVVFGLEGYRATPPRPPRGRRPPPPVARPGSAGSPRRQTGETRRGNARQNSALSNRMNPARQTSSTPRLRSSATTLRSYSSRGKPWEGFTMAGNPRSRAISSPRAWGRFEITAAISACRRPEATLFAMASKFEPRPDSRMPRRFNLAPRSRRHTQPRAGGNAPHRQSETKFRRACAVPPVPSRGFVCRPPGSCQCRD